MTFRKSIGAVGVVVAAALGGAFAPGCVSSDEATPGASELRPDFIPDGAQYVSQQEYRRRQRDRATVDITNQRARDTREAWDDAVRAAEDYLATDAVRRARFNNRAPFVDGQFEDQGEHWRVRVGDNDGGSDWYVTHARQTRLATLGSEILRFPRRANQVALYRTLYNITPSAMRVGMPSPDALNGASAMQIFELNRAIAAREIDIRNYIRPTVSSAPPGWSEDCATEVGYENNTDVSPGACARQSNGIFETVSFPLRYGLTCIRDQARRGTCVSFATNAAIEAEAIRVYGSRTNLSEQHFYWFARNYSPWTDVDGDGLIPDWSLNDAEDEDYLFGLERFWNYNPSNSRRIDATSGAITSSCNNYAGEMCTDTIPQGETLCTTNGNVTHCTATAPSTGAGFKVNGHGALWNAVDRFTALRWANIVLDSGRPLIFGLDVTDDFFAATQRSTGVMEYHVDLPIRGGHAVLLVGAIDNARLPSDVAPGVGGGYYIVRNSWGTCRGDGGYLYMPYAVAFEYGLSLDLLVEGLH